MSSEARFQELVASSTKVSLEALHELFDSLDNGLVLGVMDRKGDAFPLFFYLRRLPREAVR